MSDIKEREFNPLKILHHLDRLKALAEVQDIAPVTIEIDPVAYCNHHCSWCVDPVHHKASMDMGTFDAMISDLAGFSVNGFRVEGIVLKGGGEPTLHDNFGDIVERATKLGFSVGVVTNGSRLKRWADLLGNLASYVRISIDAPTPESHARIHGSKDFGDIVEGVEHLVIARDGRRHPVIGLTFAMDIHSVGLAEEAIHLGEKTGIDYILLRPPFFEEVGREPTMSIPETQTVRKHLQHAAEAYSGRLDVMVGNWIGDTEQGGGNHTGLEVSGRRDMQLGTKLPIEHRTGRCLASPLLAVVTADGELYGCCNLRALPEWSFGRLDYENGIGFRELWYGPQRRNNLTRMHRTECIRHCTHPMARYNEMVEVLRDSERPHSEFV
uniref:Radical SAM superfamily enzyme, MoaA/NifB/PqqE/SkfB family n=1 Tax=Candidatus Kentrum sp. MB TaxID=2138164 RepID=A0A450XLY9_9GAMM|nr:MAG: Radical SAM superfamily enzyme, MoaA/NifB/PqqE/SkfB family [Candidatus Kentron sp. MB]VFK75167.1 MAG: Radical SAM superfamily enzyme, MoaA/NifB/PqqE/SkfB family [Candidatus Kentron sp. MB]